MAGGINKQPAGLLDFLGIKNFGRYPSVLSDVLAGTMDLELWYLSQNSRSQFYNGNAAAVGFNTLVTVPQTETWAIIGSCVNSQAALGAGQTLQVAGCFIRDPTANIVSPLSPLSNVATTGSIAASLSDQAVIWVPAGAQIGLYVTQLVAGPVPCTFNLNYVPMIR